MGRSGEADQLTDLAFYQDLARSFVAGRKLIVPGGVLARSGSRAASLRALSAERPFLLASGRGTGPQPTAEEAEVFSLDIRAPRIIEEIRATERALADLPQRAIDAIDGWDPDRSAIVLGTPFTRSTSVAGRPVIGRRPDAWEALEDKVVCDEIWDAAGVEREPMEIVASSLEKPRSVAKRVDRGYGTVWAGDAREGYNGGAEYVRWVRRPEDVQEAATFFGRHCDRVRVMPFLEGIPCSVHGFVLGDETAVFRPIELITLRRQDNRFQYAGVASYWDPSDQDRDAMRKVAHRVGREISSRVGYRGGYTVDGVMTSDGFRPTELNARFGAGVNPQVGTLDLPLGLLNTIAIESPETELRLADLERLVVEHADGNRGGGCYSVSERERSLTEETALVEEDGLYRRARPDEAPQGALQIGPSGMGGFVGYSPKAGQIPSGPAFASHAVRVFAFADDEFDTGFGPLEAARDVRGSS